MRAHTVRPYADTSPLQGRALCVPGHSEMEVIDYV